MSDSDDKKVKKSLYRRDQIKTATIVRRTSGNITKDRKKRIMILCPVCKSTHILQGRERYLYIRQAIIRKELKYGKTCSPECQKKLMNPKTRKDAHKVAHLYKEMPRDVKRTGRPVGSKTRDDPQYTTPVALKKKRDDAITDDTI